MKVLVDIPDNEVVFGMKVLKSLSFVKKVKPISIAKVDLWEDLKEASEQVILLQTRKGKIENSTRAFK